MATKYKSVDSLQDLADKQVSPTVTKCDSSSQGETDPEYWYGKTDPVRLRREVMPLIRTIHAISGHNPQNACARVCRKMKDLEIHPYLFWMFLNEWNDSNAHPRFSDRDLRKHFRDVFSRNPYSKAV